MCIDIDDILLFGKTSCPQNHTDWQERSSTIHCAEEEEYLCLPNRNYSEFFEFCLPRSLAILKGESSKNVYGTVDEELVAFIKLIYKYRSKWFMKSCKSEKKLFLKK